MGAVDSTQRDHAAEQRRYRARHPELKEHWLEVQRAWRKANAEAARASKRAWDDAHKDNHRKSTKRYRIRHRQQNAAHMAVCDALRRGKIVRRPCEVCGTTEMVHAHHADYTKPLDVKWLCHRHHAVEHGISLVLAARITSGTVMPPGERGKP